MLVKPFEEYFGTFFGRRRSDSAANPGPAGVADVCAAGNLTCLWSDHRVFLPKADNIRRDGLLRFTG